MTRDPFKIDGPACISFSGGRTSGMMLKKILDAHGGKLPDDVIVCFANTGKEMPETLDFVRDCADAWNVSIVWLEYAGKNDDGKKLLAVVNHGSCSRDGEPFIRLLKDRNFLPNPVARFCTVELKIRVIHRYLKSIGFMEWTSCIGYRSDESKRIARLGNQDYGKHEEKIAPLSKIGVTKYDVAQFWRDQPFDLQLPNMNGTTMHGNCDLCFLKGGNQVLALIREEPERATWWIKAESLALASKPSGAMFRTDRPSYASMLEMALGHGELFPFHDDKIECMGCTD